MFPLSELDVAIYEIQHPHFNYALYLGGFRPEHTRTKEEIPKSIERMLRRAKQIWNLTPEDSIPNTLGGHFHRDYYAVHNRDFHVTLSKMKKDMNSALWLVSRYEDKESRVYLRDLFPQGL